jgi:hypothetical protein
MAKTLSPSSLRRRRDSLLRRLPDLNHVLRGSLIERYKRCGKPGCGCARTRGHGPKYYLSVSHPGRLPEMDYIPSEYRQSVQQLLANLGRIRDILEEVCQINRELLRRREKL